MDLDNLSYKVIGLAIKVHKNLGPGLLESAYKECLFHEMNKANITVAKEYPIFLIYEEIKLDCGYKIDLLVENSLVIEIKSVESLNNIHLAQVLTYLKIGNFNLGLLINFNVTKIKSGIKRVIFSNKNTF